MFSAWDMSIREGQVYVTRSQVMCGETAGGGANGSAVDPSHVCGWRRSIAHLTPSAGGPRHDFVADMARSSRDGPCAACLVYRAWIGPPGHAAGLRWRRHRESALHPELVDQARDQTAGFGFFNERREPDIRRLIALDRKSVV